jgi:glycine dehydrogenase
MLAMLGLGSLNQLIDETVPEAIRTEGPLDVPSALSEAAVSDALRTAAATNEVLTSMIGLGYYGTHTPAVIRRNLLENPAWYTAYTPYQAEISQGRLEALLNFQTLISDLTGLPIAGASMLDEATAAAEAMTLARRVSPAPVGAPFVVDIDVNPQVLAVLRTRADPLGIPLCESDLSAEDGTGRTLPRGQLCGVLVQYPSSSGVIRDHRVVIEAAHRRGALAVISSDLLALCLLRSPGDLGADVAVGSSQRFGVPLGFGGPHAGYLAVRHGLERSMPGRLVGVSADAEGNPAYRLALQTREQHIRREKATSNLCTAQSLLAIVAGMYAVYHGPEGLINIARRTHRRAVVLSAGLRQSGINVLYTDFFDTLRVETPGRGVAVVAAARKAGINVLLVNPDTVGVSCDELTTVEHLRSVWQSFGVFNADPVDLDDTTADAIPLPLRRSGAFLSHPVFHRHHSETSMVRYLRRLADADLALDRSMIPLGSCTMKLNATVELEPISWPGFADIHPFAPSDQVKGYRQIIEELEHWLATITGYDAVSLQPNAGSQGELAGLLAVRSYHRHRGDDARDICLVPSSAHGTNAASAVMAGMRVVVVGCDAQGNVDVSDVAAKIGRHRDQLAALMITYPSTHGVFETEVARLCALTHAAGGQVYLDGANLNALVGVAKPGEFGADVSHLNLHKTFCIPHGGGGPGVGPVAVRSHLIPHLPGHPMGGSSMASSSVPSGGPVSAAPWGSAGIVPISWAYLRLMGPDGLTRATQVAILAANYVAARLAPHYPVLYRGSSGRVAHECILDIRPLTKASGVTVDDIAKRLMDYGFHAPTMSFPVAGTFMVEPTESEDLGELDRFCAAMIAIREEIDQVQSGVWPRDNNPLRNAPHTATMLVGQWPHPYSRSVAVFPDRTSLSGNYRSGKYWPPVRRVDGGLGDRNLMCSCPPVANYEK